MSRFLSATALLLLLAMASPTHGQQVEGINLDFTQLPEQLRKPFPVDLDNDAFRVRLREGGTWTFSKQDVVLGKPDPQANSVHFMALDTLELKDGARIITNGNTLVIFVNKLNIGDGRIVSFVDDTAASGAPASTAGNSGGRGGRGDDGGIVSIHVIQRINGFLDVDLHGQNGGGGGAGAQGKQGEPGRDGANGLSSMFDCRKGGENGGDGHKGNRGGDGGAGGDGGSGGSLFLYNIANEPISAASYRFTAVRGAAGAGGAPGAGGIGGDGGRRGGGDGHCKGGERDGNRGPGGDAGEKGVDGSVGADGNPVVKALKLQAVIDLVKKAPADWSVNP